jgi:hypothetical protein
MSTTIPEAAKASQDQILATVKQSQQAVVDAVAAWAQAVQNVVPAVPTIPGTDELPKPETVVDNAFEFASQLLDAQHDFARRVLAAAAPVVEKSSTRAKSSTKAA